MKYNMKYIVAFVLSLSAVAYAQNNTSAVPMPSSREPGAGFYMGLDYMNFTDSRAEQKATEVSTEESINMSMAGIQMGFDKTPMSGLGFRAGIRMLQAIDQEEDSGDAYADGDLYAL